MKTFQRRSAEFRPPARAVLNCPTPSKRRISRLVWYALLLNRICSSSSSVYFKVRAGVCWRCAPNQQPKNLHPPTPTQRPTDHNVRYRLMIMWFVRFVFRYSASCWLYGKIKFLDETTRRWAEEREKNSAAVRSSRNARRQAVPLKKVRSRCFSLSLNTPTILPRRCISRSLYLKSMPKRIGGGGESYLNKSATGETEKSAAVYCAR